ncbi:preprotein translocase subunit SecG [Alteromonadaceae bacterium M269]|nr:preprotein translocase subunit SecG [Alteromonadaceae bacterium M269]
MSLYEVLLVVYLIVALMLIGLVLIQQGKGAGMGASFGSGASNTVFGATGSGNFMTRATAILATAFFAISLILGNMSNSQKPEADPWQDLEVPVAEEVPATTPTDSDVPDVPN